MLSSLRADAKQARGYHWNHEIDLPASHLHSVLHWKKIEILVTVLKDQGTAQPLAF